MINISVIEDHKMFGICLKEYLLRHNDINVCNEELNDINELLISVKNKKYDIVITDLFMPGVNTHDLIKELAHAFADVKIIVVSMCTELSMINSLLDIGIHNYFSKADDPEDLIKAIYAAYENRIYKNKLFTEALYWGLSNKQKTRESKKIIFNDREIRLIQLLWMEKSNKDIACELFLGLRSIEKIRQDMKDRVGVKTTIGLLKYAVRNQIICVDSFPKFIPAMSGV